MYLHGFSVSVCYANDIHGLLTVLIVIRYYDDVVQSDWVTACTIYVHVHVPYTGYDIDIHDVT